MQSLAARTGAIPERRGEAPWPGHEYVRGWGVFGLPFDSGHVLALRVFPEGSFGPNRAVWHRDPAGRWSIYYDAPRAEIACPRYFGSACHTVSRACIDLSWMGPRTLHIEVDDPRLTWTVTARRSASLGVLNSVMATMPRSSWRVPALVRMHEKVAALLGLGDITLGGRTPNGYDGLLMPQRMYLVEEAEAVLGGRALGRPTHTSLNPTIGEVRLPACGVIAIGEAMWTLGDTGEPERARHDQLQDNL